MRPISPILLQHLSSIFQFRERAPSAIVYIIHPETKEKMQVDRIISIDTDRRDDSPAGEFQITVDNSYGWLSPNFGGLAKFPDIIPDRGAGDDSNPWPGVIWPNTKVEIYLGYGSELLRQITGLIDSVNINSQTKTITIKGRTTYKRIIVETVKPPAGKDKIVYKNKTVKQIIVDIHNRLMIPIDAQEIFIYGTQTPYMVSELVLERGTNWQSVIDELLRNIYARLWSRHDGASVLRPVREFKQSDREDLVLDEAVNLTNLEYNIDDMDIKNTLTIRYDDKHSSTYVDLFLKDQVCRGQVREDFIDVKYADTEAKRRQAAMGIFRRYKQKLRSITVASVGNPAAELYDVTRIREHISGVTQKYFVRSIRTSFSKAGYFDLMDLEFAI